jgi:simple sugar transport system ATP-binding protein
MSVPEAAERGSTTNGAAPLLEVRNVSKYFGNVIALKDVSCHVGAGQVTCVLGDNGAGKSTFIKILSGVHHHSEGQYLCEGEEVKFHSPRDARERGIATVFQDLATVPLMSIWRNFFLGSEPTVGSGPLRRIDVKEAKRVMHDEMRKMGIDVRDADQPVGTLSGGERQAVSIARAVYFGAKVLILDEPTSALGVKQSGVVLKYIVQARERGLGVIFITHNPHHAFPVGDRFVILNRGRLQGNWDRNEISRDELVKAMSGGAELDQLTHEIERQLQRPAGKG